MKRILVVAAALAVLAGVALGRDIDLVTLPPRDGVQLTIYNSEDLTLVKEVRSVTFKKGPNRLQFSWANTLIDPTSVYLRPLEQAAQIEVSDTTFPADRPQVLVWNVESAFEGQVKVEVSYFTSGISWNADYVMLTDAAETQASVDGYVTVVNGSGEDYEGAEVRLVVGVVNLVEKIAQLARQPAKNGGRQEGRAVRKEVLAQAIELADANGAPAGAAAKPGAPPRIVKEGLSEYFIFTIEGAQTVRNGWSQRMISFRARQVPFEVLYRYRPHQYGPRPVRFFILANDVEHKMGTSPLPDGVIRVFRDNGRDGLNFFTAQASKYIPIREKIELNVGPDDQMVYERLVLDLARKNFLYDHDPPVVVGWDETRSWQEEVRNYRAKPIQVEIRHVLEGDVEFTAEAVGGLTLYDYRTPQYLMTIPAGKAQKWVSQGLFHLGTNQKQNRVRLAGK
ncbi:MAG TPA: hypothetical protein VNA25_13775 [Phycisphaerae bacterium]|nr:hypothetical protein [Phycisphaerae bacterium]